MPPHKDTTDVWLSTWKMLLSVRFRCLWFVPYFIDHNADVKESNRCDFRRLIRSRYELQIGNWLLSEWWSDLVSLESAIYWKAVCHSRLDWRACGIRARRAGRGLHGARTDLRPHSSKNLPPPLTRVLLLLGPDLENSAVMRQQHKEIELLSHCIKHVLLVALGPTLSC